MELTTPRPSVTVEKALWMKGRFVVPRIKNHLIGGPMSNLTKLSAWMTIAAAIGVVCQATAFGQDLSVATVTPAEPPAQLLSDAAQLSGSPLTLTDAEQNSVHIFPTVSFAATASSSDPGPLLYHAGGSIMPRLNIYSIYWKPAHLQSGATASMSAAYRAVVTNLNADYVGHGIHNNNTQYYQTIGGVTTNASGLLFSVAGVGSNAGTYLDTGTYPASGCTDTKTPGNCITEVQLETELLRVMTLKGWTGGLDKIFMIYTAQNEGSCFDSSSSSCAYVQYCAYHGHTVANSQPVIFANIPYGDTTVCQIAGQPSPNANPAADAASTGASHEITEAVTDPLLNAWFTSQGNEIGDLCAYNYGSNPYDGGLANQSWNGHFYELQQEFDNHAGGCVQVGP
jgi:hypothetical protein